MSTRRRALLFGMVVLTTTLCGVSTALAHDPIILTDSQTTPDAGPLLPDGTVSFALYGTVNAAGDTRGLRVRFHAGDAVDISLLIPALAPERDLPAGALPTLRMDAPDGTSRTLTATERTQFDESFSHTSYIRYLEVHEPAQAGEYRLTVVGAAPARFTLAVGTKEQFGTPVQNVPNRADGTAGVQRWYTTPPPAAATVPATTTDAATTGVPTTTSPRTTSPRTTVAPSPVTSSTVVPTAAAATGGPSALAVLIGALAVVAVGAAWFLRQRRRPPS